MFLNTCILNMYYILLLLCSKGWMPAFFILLSRFHAMRAADMSEKLSIAHN